MTMIVEQFAAAKELVEKLEYILPRLDKFLQAETFEFHFSVDKSYSNGIRSTCTASSALGQAMLAMMQRTVAKTKDDLITLGIQWTDDDDKAALAKRRQQEEDDSELPF